MRQARGLLALLLLVSNATVAAPVSQELAQAAAQGWVADSRYTLAEKFSGKSVADTTGFKDAAGATLFYRIAFENGGYVVATADDQLFPVIAFSSSGTLQDDPNDPLWVMLMDDMPQRMAFVHTQEAAAAKQTQPVALGNTAAGWMEANRNAWNELSTGSVAVPLGLSSLPDVRVAPLVKSTWSQSTVGAYNVFNYYTPNNYVCGCVATAMAQLMRFHQYPADPVTARTKTCYVDGISTSLTIQGGSYAWSDMPLSPKSSITLTQRQAIGKLAYDAGVSVCMQYSADGSGANGGMACIAFAEIFGYANARGYTALTAIDAAGVARSVLANLDGGYPVMLGIEGDYGGHAVIGDGYGYSGTTLYVHLNMGWSGNQDAWYNLPDVDDAWYGFTSIRTVVYNVYPSGTGDLLTGRVTSSYGDVIAGATVTATKSGTTYTATTDAKGIYALRLPGGNGYSVTASYAGKSKSANVTVASSVSTTYIEPSSYQPLTGTIGNSWGNNFVLAVAPSAPTGVTASDGSVTDNVAVSWSASSGATSYSVWRGTSSSSSAATDIASDINTTTYSDTSATPGVLYYYWVKAENADGASGFSAADTGYRKLSAPAVIAATGYCDKVRVSWSAVAGATHYRVSRAAALAGAKSVVSAGWQSGLLFDDATAVAGVTYYYFVEAAVNSTGTRPSDYSSGVAGMRLMLAPTIEEIKFVTISDVRYLQISFEARAGRSYIVQRSDNLKNISWVAVATISGTTDGVKTVNVAIPANKSSGFYRICLVE